MAADFVYEQGLKTKGLPSVQVFSLRLPSATLASDIALGQLIYDENTGAIYKYVQATAAGISANTVVSYLDASGYKVATSAASAAGVASRAGVAPYAFTASYYGFILIHGKISVSASGTGYVLGDPVAPDLAAAGKVIEATIATPTAAETVRAAAIMGFALGVESGGFVDIFVNRCL
jgi:hypothetical protein